MAKLSEIYKAIGDYMKMYGDKEVTSIGTAGGRNRKIEYIFHLYDIHEGDIGSNPYTGSDKIDIPK
jgi:hypothetical protein